MSTTSLRGLIASGAWCVLALCAAPALAAAADPRLTKVLEDWARRQSKFDSVRYVISGQTTFVKNSWSDERSQPYNPPRPSRDFVGKVRWGVLLDFAAHRSRWEVDEEDYFNRPEQVGSEFPRREELERILRLNVCDGKIAQNSRPPVPGVPRDEGPITPANLDMTIVRGNLNTVIFPGGSLPLFHGHGIIPTSEDLLYAGHMRRDLNPEQLYIYGTGVHEGRACLVVRTEVFRPSSQAFDEFWVDTARQSAIVRYARYSHGEVVANDDVRYEESRDGWMPASWSHTAFVKRATCTITKLQVESRVMSPPLHDQDFRLEVKAGMRVRQVEFGQLANPLAWGPAVSDSMKVADANFVASEGRGTTLRRFLSWWWLATAPAALVVVGLFLWAWKARRAHRKQIGRVSS